MALSTNPKDVDWRFRLSQAIQNSTFKFEDFVKEIPPNTCLWHGNHHPTHKCKTIEYFLEQANHKNNESIQDYAKKCEVALPKTPVAKHIAPTEPPPPDMSYRNALETIE